MTTNITSNSNREYTVNIEKGIIGPRGDPYDHHYRTDFQCTPYTKNETDKHLSYFHINKNDRNGVTLFKRNFNKRQQKKFKNVT